jgi:hypothetical protein
MKTGKLQMALMATALAVMMAPSNLFAYAGSDGTLYFTNSTFQNGDGGEFNAVTTGLGSFGTFCLEAGEFISQPPAGGPYTYTINTGAVQGGGVAGGANTTDPNNPLLTMDNVSLGTAWLYSQFRAGTLTLDDGTGSYFSNELANAGELQQAIWYLEDEAPGQSNGYVVLAENELSETLPQIKADSNGAYNVVALNLFDSNGNLAQDQLGIDPEFVPVPEPTTAGCFLLGLGTLAWWKRFQNRKR